MNLIIISGFLGSGKTTILLEIAKHISAQGRKVAIIENEIGKVGVDDTTLKEEGLEVKEIYSGCICCSLRMDLVAALLEIERDYAPDVVILEPSGVAGPRQVLDALTGYGGEIDSKRMLSIVDASRFSAIQNMSIPLVTDGIQIADTILVNKADLVSSDEQEAIIKRIKDYRSDAHVILTSALTSIGLTESFEALSLPASRAPVMAPEEKKGPKPTVYTHESQTVIASSLDQFTETVTAMIEAFTVDVENAGCSLIGHIKAVIKTNKGGYFVISKTDSAHPAQTKGRLPKTAESATLTLNAIVYGVDKSVLEELATKIFV